METLRDSLIGIDWLNTLVPTTPLLETVTRGTLMYLGLFFLLRVMKKRQAGSVGVTDLLLVVLIADAAQNGMADDYRSVADGLLLVMVIIFWDLFMDWLGYRFPKLQRLVHPSPLLLVQEGRIIRHNMRKELVTVDELMALLREQGVEDLTEVREAFMEGNGRLSVLKRGGGSGSGSSTRKGAPGGAA